MKTDSLSSLYGLLDPATQQPRSRHFWVIVGGVILAQVIALWMLCTHQVSQAEVRQAQVHSQQVALADCLQNRPDASLALCSGRIERDNREPVKLDRVMTATAANSGVVPVVYTR